MSREPPWLVAIGASGADGLRQLLELFEALPPDLQAAVLVVLHRPSERKSYLLEILQRATLMPVWEAHDGERLRAGHCYLGWPDEHLTIDEGRTARLQPDGAYRARNIDLLFESAARSAGPRVIGVVLAGALRDGAAGLAAIKAAGGKAMVVNGDWSQRQGMPSAARAAVPDLDLAGSTVELADAIAAAVGRISA